MKFIKYSLVLAGVVAISGCTHTIQNYSPSFSNIQTLKKLSQHSDAIAVGSFVDPQYKKSIGCRLEGTEKLPGGITYVAYIRNALRKELKTVGLYSPRSKVKLSAKLIKINFNSVKGYWYIAMRFNDHKQASYSVGSVYKFSSSAIADIACTKVATAFVPAVQKFLSTLYHNKHFQRTLRNT